MSEIFIGILDIHPTINFFLLVYSFSQKWDTYKCKTKYPEYNIKANLVSITEILKLSICSMFKESITL